MLKTYFVIPFTRQGNNLSDYISVQNNTLLYFKTYNNVNVV